MNKKTNTILFMLGATIVNVLMMVIIFVLLFWLYGRFIATHVSPQVTSYAMIGLASAATVASIVLGVVRSRRGARRANR